MKNKEGLRNIYYFRNEGTYYIQKQMYGKRYYYGRFKTREEAVKYRDFLEANDWKVEPKTMQDVNENKENGWANSPRYRIARMFGINPEEIV